MCAEVVIQTRRVHERRAHEEGNLGNSSGGRVGRREDCGGDSRTVRSRLLVERFSLLLRSVFLSVAFNHDTTLALICLLHFDLSRITYPT